MNYFQTIPYELTYSILEYLDYPTLVKFRKPFLFNWESFFQFTEPRLYNNVRYPLQLNKELEAEGIWPIFYKNLLKMRTEFKPNDFKLLLQEPLADVLYKYDKIFLEILYINDIYFKHFYVYYLKLVKEGIESILALEWVYNWAIFEGDNMTDGIKLKFPLVNKKPFDIFQDFAKDEASSLDILMLFLLYHDKPEMKMDYDEYDRILIHMVAYDLLETDEGIFGRKNYKKVYEKLRVLYDV